MNSDSSSSSSDRIHAAAERVKQSESAAVHRTAERVEHGLHRATDVGADAVAGVSERADDLTARGRAAAENLRGHANDLFDKTRDFVREKPGQAVLIAITAEWLLGRLTRR